MTGCVLVGMGCAWCVKQKVWGFEERENKILLRMLRNSEVLFMFNSSSWDLSPPLLLFKDQLATLFLEESPPPPFFFLFSNSHSLDTHRPLLNSLLTFSLNFTRKRLLCISRHQSTCISKVAWCHEECSEFYLNIQIQEEKCICVHQRLPFFTTENIVLLHILTYVT